MEFISSKQLAQIFSGRKGQELFPLLIKKLIISSCNKKGNIRFPSGDSIWCPGFDGIVTNITDSYSLNVPIGNSVWELGTNSDSLAKVNSDYDLRTNAETEYKKENYTFILAVPKIWAYSESLLDWEEARRRQNIWQDVRVIDAEILSDWISENIEVGIWLLNEVDCKSKIDIDTLLTKWHKVVNLTIPKFNSDLMLNSNIDKKDKIIDRIKSDARKIVIRSHYGKEHALYVTLGAFNSLEDKAITERVIYANNKDSLEHIINNCKDKIVVTESYYNFVLGNSNTYIILLHDSDRTVPVDIELNYCTLEKFSSALESIGIDKGESYKLARKVNNNISILKRRLAIEPLIKKPAWANDENKDTIIPLLLVSEFYENDSTDQELLEIISNESFNEYAQSLSSWVGYDDSPVFKYDNVYKINSKEECLSVIDLSEIYNAIRRSFAKNFQRRK